MKYTMCLTQECNLSCYYCYIGKRGARMSHSVARSIIDFAFQNTPPDEKIEIGLFGGEPLLEFGLMREVIDLVEGHELYDSKMVKIDLVTNGTIFTQEIAEFIKGHNIRLCISCDGPAPVQDVFRRIRSGGSSCKIVESTIRRAVEDLSMVQVNAVYHPKTFEFLPAVVEYFVSLGVSGIHLNADYSASWSQGDLERLQNIYDKIAEIYMKSYLEGRPIFVGLIDYKIAAILRGGYGEHERCRMGRGEYAFTPEGNIYPCERLIGEGGDGGHCIGHINTGLHPEKMATHKASGEDLNSQCLSCSIKDYCMNWCGCSNFMSSGFYNRASAFTCASQRALINTAFRIFRTLEEKLGPTFYIHLVCDE